MKKYVSMLRGINVGGRKRIGMEALRRAYASIGFSNVQTYIQSGNVIFEEVESEDRAKLAKRIEGKIKSDFGFDVLAFLRSANDLQNLISNNPFRNADLSKVHVTFLYTRPSSDFSLDEMGKAKGRGEDFKIAGEEVYLLCPNGYGISKLSNTFFERKLKVRATTRNWNTVNSLFYKAAARES
jgi:uncharacterized protein (DUF1697 family)